MKKDIIEIRSNINNTVDRLIQAEREREEREKAEREERLAMEREERERKEQEWKAAHPVLDKYTYIGYHNYETYSWKGDLCKIRFYEWSDITREPITFDTTIPFYRFIDSCGIKYLEEDNNKMKANAESYMVCKPGCNELIVAPSYESLKSQFHMAKNLAKVLAVVPEV